MKRQVLLTALCMGMGLFGVYFFILLHIQGVSCWTEPNPWILWAELIGFGGIILFGLYMFVRLLRKG